MFFNVYAAKQQCTLCFASPYRDFLKVANLTFQGAKNGIEQNQVQNETLIMDKCYSKRRNKPFFLLLIMSVAIDLGALIHNFSPELKREVRDLEKVSIRRCKRECALLFNSICVKEHLLPNYSNIYEEQINKTSY